MRIKKRLALTMLTLICIPLIIMALMIYAYSSKALIAKAKMNINQVAAIEGKALEKLVEAKENEVEVLGLDKMIVKVLEKWEMGDVVGFNKVLSEVEALLNGVEKNEEECCGIYIINCNGDIVASSKQVYVRGNVARNEGFRRVLQGKTVFKNIITDHKEGVSDITAPVRNSGGEIVGAVCKTIKNSTFGEFVEEIKSNEGGCAYIVDSKGIIIIHPNKSKIGCKVEDEGIIQVIKGEGPTSKLERWLVKGMDDGALSYMSFYRIPSIDWIIVASQTARVVRQQAVTELISIAITLAFLVFILGIASIHISRKITGPIDEIVNVMGEVSRGKLDEYCKYDADDEFGSLAKHYNQMIKKLGESRRALSVSEERYRQTLADIEETIWEYDLRTDMVFITGKWSNIISIEDNLEGNIPYKDVVKRKALMGIDEEIKACEAGKKNVFNRELNVRSADGAMAWGLCKGKVVYDEAGEMIKIRGIITDITNYKASEEQVRKLAYYDVLTGCLNKQTFTTHMRRYIGLKKEGEKAAMLFVDLDDFQRVNDIFGHDVGDEVLKYVVRKLSEIAMDGSIMSRFGGDEFVVCANMKNLEEVEVLVHKIMAIFEDEIIIGENEIHMTCSIGIALYPLDGDNCEVLLQNADTAMYKSKEQGKNSYNFYSEDMSKALARKMAVESAIRDAISGKNGLYLQYQPVVETATGKTVGAEALVRLKSEKIGFISPGEFIPIAEETGIIVEVGDWVIKEALKALSNYYNQGYDYFSVNINVSAVQLREKNFIEKLKSCIDEAGIPPKCIKLEVTETVLMQNLEENKVIFHEAREMGMKIALDDFGTGYSSLNYLRNIPLDVLKIDKSFIDEITVSKELSEIVDSIINMAHILEIDVVAEGVESEQQLEILKQKDCDLIQGYVFSKPLMEEELNERLQMEKIS